MSTETIPQFSLEKCGPSKAVDVSVALRKPITSIVSKAVISYVKVAYANPYNAPLVIIGNIARLVLDTLVATILLIPALISYGVGTFIGKLAPTKLNKNALNLTPSNSYHVPHPEDFPNTNLHDIATYYKKHFPDDAEGLQILQQRLTIIENRGDDASRQARAYFLGIVHQFNQRNIPDEKQRDVLRNLLDAIKVCGPTWSEGARSEYEKLTARVAADQVLRHVQNFKEELLKLWGQVKMDQRHWHFINVIRKSCGREFGLNVPLEDQHAQGTTNLPVKFLFMSIYDNVPNLVRGIQSAFNAERYNQDIFDFLREIVEGQGVEDADAYVREEFYDENFQLNYKAVCTLLKAVRVLV